MDIATIFRNRLKAWEDGTISDGEMLRTTGQDMLVLGSFIMAVSDKLLCDECDAAEARLAAKTRE